MISVRAVGLVMVGLSILVTTAPAPGQEQSKQPPSQWEHLPGKRLGDFLSVGGELISTESLTWPDGRSALVVYAKQLFEIYRCIDWYDKDFRPTGYTCARLTRPELPIKK